VPLYYNEESRASKKDWPLSYAPALIPVVSGGCGRAPVGRLYLILACGVEKAGLTILRGRCHASGTRGKWGCQWI